MSDDTLVVICAVCGTGEGRYILDAFRWIELVEAKGVNPANIHLFVHAPRMYDAESLLRGVTSVQPDVPLSIKSEHLPSYLQRFHRGTPVDMLQELPRLASDSGVSRVTVVLIDHMSFTGDFGTPEDVVIDQNALFLSLNQLTKPSVIVCATCHAQRIFYLLDREHQGNNLVKIWDKGEKGVTYNWGIRPPSFAGIFDMGTRLCYALFRILYDAKHLREVYSSVVELDVRKALLDTQICYAGNIRLLLHEPFFGPNPPSVELVQPPPSTMLPTSPNPVQQSKRVQFMDELVELVDKFLATSPSVDPVLKSLFWECVYDAKHGDITLKMENGFESGVAVWKALKSHKLLRNETDGAFLMDLLVTHELDQEFIAFTEAAYTQ